MAKEEKKQLLNPKQRNEQQKEKQQSENQLKEKLLRGNQLKEKLLQSEKLDDENNLFFRNFEKQRTLIESPLFCGKIKFLKLIYYMFSLKTIWRRKQKSS